jgi:hypothetical protein
MFPGSGDGDVESIGSDRTDFQNRQEENTWGAASRTASEIWTTLILEAESAIVFTVPALRIAFWSVKS